MQISQLTKAQISEVRSIAKSFGIKGCKMGNFYCHVGKQCNPIARDTAHAFMDDMKAKGFHIDGEPTCRELADKGLFDSAMVAKIC